MSGQQINKERLLFGWCDSLRTAKSVVVLGNNTGVDMFVPEKR